jgi:hypothetical protein
MAAATSAAGGALTQSGRSGPAECQRHSEAAPTAVQEREVEAVQVVVFDDVRVGRRDPGHQAADQVGFGGIALTAGLQDFGNARRVADRRHEDAIVLRVQPGGLQIELQAMEVIEGEISEVRPSGGHQVLFLGRQRENRLFAEIAEARYAPPQPPGRAL